jgi:AcrR family transcriptional regulator
LTDHQLLNSSFNLVSSLLGNFVQKDRHVFGEAESESVSLDQVSHNQIGQKIGTKGLRTRQKLIGVTVELLETHGLRDLTVADIARAAGNSPATFYVYFEGVPEVVLAALESVTQSSPELVEMARQDWSAPGNDARSREFVEAYCDHWWRWRTVFRCRNLASEEGDVRFQEARRQSVAPLIDALATQIAQSRAGGKVPTHLAPRACAAAILTLLERLAAVGPTTPPQPDIDFAMLKNAAAHMIQSVCG